jgi:short-subunit dehydrogenase
MKKNIIIVGSSSGIGKRMAELYAEQGYKVGITGRRSELLNELKQKFPEQIETECFDVTGDKNIENLQNLVNKLGGMDLLVISAGIGEPSKDLKWEIDQQTLKTNVDGFLEVANWSFNYFINQGHGHLVTISSLAANRGSGWAPAYAASKAFQSIYFEGLSIKARKMAHSAGSVQKVFITNIEPGFVNTKMAKGGNKMFWVVPVEKAAKQIIRAIERKKRKAYISRRWWIVAKLMRWMPFFIYKRIGS